MQLLNLQPLKSIIGARNIHPTAGLPITADDIAALFPPPGFGILLSPFRLPHHPISNSVIIMWVVPFKSSFLASPLTSTFNPTGKTCFTPASKLTISCGHSPDHDLNEDSSSKKIGNQLGKLAVVTLAAGVLALGAVDPASAAKSGGRVGGQAFKSAAPRPSSPRINNSRTNIYVNPPVAPPLVGGYGFGFGVPFYGGWGWTPFSFFAPGPSVAVGVGGGFDLFFFVLILGAVSAVIRKFLSSRDEDIDEY